MPACSHACLPVLPFTPLNPTARKSDRTLAIALNIYNPPLSSFAWLYYLPHGWAFLHIIKPLGWRLRLYKKALDFSKDAV